MYIDDLRTYREGARLTISELAKKSELDRGTITRIEKHYCAKKISLLKIVDTLNSLHYTKRGKTLDPDKVITEYSRYGKGLDVDSVNTN